MPAQKTILQHVYDHAEKTPDRIYLTQPLGGDKVEDFSWQRVVDEAKRMAAYLQSSGLSRGDKVAMLSKNCAHFFIAELAIWMGGFTTVAIFPTEGPDTVKYVLEHSEAKALFVGKLDPVWKQQKTGIPEGVKQIGLPLAPEGESFPKWSEIIRKTEPLAGRPEREPGDVALIIYTSGSTGTPKGVMHSYGAVSEVGELIVKAIRFTPDDRALSYLPLAHVFERAYIEIGSLVSGAHIFFADKLDTFVQDLRRARPTVFISVPRLWLKFQQGVFTKMPPGRLDFLLKVPFVGSRVAKKVLTGLGLEHVRLAGSGSAPIPAELIAWYRRLGLNLLEGYAMSEDLAYSHLSTVEHNAPGCVGVPLPGVDVKLSEEGEVLIKSPGKLMGYYKRPDLDAEVFTADGYFRTGDKGERTPEGVLRLTGRVKELFKTAKGKYVAPAPIENKINEHPLVELSCVSGVGQFAAFGYVVLAEDIRPKMTDADVRARVEKELGEHLDKVNTTLSGYEQMDMLVIAKEPFTIENGLLTPTMKIKRAKIEELFKGKLDQWYEAKKKVVWS
jgi:long-subunit acyl-CoA synthetase (AMP-forming)